MSGPNIFAPKPGSNAIGSFAIGISPIGDIIPFNLWQTIISQYANSTFIDTLIGNFQQYVDQTANFDALYDNIWNVATAFGYGLDVWGRIVNVSRTVSIPISGTTFFGFEEATDGYGFNQQPFFGGSQITQNFSLSDSAYRTLIYAKALANICDGSMKAINQILLNLFPGRGDCYVTDGQNMTMTYTFKFSLTSVELAICEQSGALPKPVGVKATIVQQIIS